MIKKIAVINQKGGVGKTATAYNLAYCLSLRKNTLLIDLDPSANATKGLTDQREFDITVSNLLLEKTGINQAAMMPIEGNTNLWLVPSSIKLALAQREVSQKPFRESLLSKKINASCELTSGSAIALIDCSPTLSDLTINAIYASDFILIPVSYEQDALEGMSDLFQVIDEVKEGQEFDYKILRNGFDGRKDVMNEYIEGRLKDFDNQGKVFNTIIRQSEEINKAKMENKPVNMAYPSSRASSDYASLTREILDAQ